MYTLKKIANNLALVQDTDSSFVPISIDFASGANSYRRKHSGLRTEAIAKAVGISKQLQPLKVLDVTAGLGKDAFILACLGCKITMVERNPMVASLLQDAIMRGLADPEITASINNMQLIHGEATAVIAEMLANPQTMLHPDVIYLDPMFPESKKSAKVKHAIQTLRDLLQNEPIVTDYSELFTLACKLATKRVVIKRHKSSAPLVTLKPTFCITGKTVRFDVYAASLRDALTLQHGE